MRGQRDAAWWGGAVSTGTNRRYWYVKDRRLIRFLLLLSTHHGSTAVGINHGKLPGCVSQPRLNPPSLILRVLANWTPRASLTRIHPQGAGSEHPRLRPNRWHRIFPCCHCRRSPHLRLPWRSLATQRQVSPRSESLSLLGVR